MSTVHAATVRSGDARSFLASRINRAAQELARQEARVRGGETYQHRIVASRLAAVDEARDLAEACELNVSRLLRAGAKSA